MAGSSTFSLIIAWSCFKKMLDGRVSSFWDTSVSRDGGRGGGAMVLAVFVWVCLGTAWCFWSSFCFLKKSLSKKRQDRRKKPSAPAGLDDKKCNPATNMYHRNDDGTGLSPMIFHCANYY
eukprot:scaffold11774_cov142-Amphora_coffeaeformis.AAC.3